MKNEFTRFFLLFVCVLIGSAHLVAQSVSGIVIDAYSLSPIPDADVIFELGAEQKKVNTDAAGKYFVMLENAGRYQIRIQKNQYHSTILTSVQVNTGRTLSLQHELTPSAFEMETIVVKANDTWSPIDRIQTEVIGIEQTERVAANFQDPARVANGYAGVVQLNDQANHLVIRGLSPIYSKWYLEGMEIVNPNHTNNAGTLSDTPTQAGGGVNMFPAQILGNTFLSKGGHPANYSNALGGILDMHYGRPDQSAFNLTANISLIGLEMKAEGPFKKGSANSWQVNYRYSTVGLLSAMGVPLGDEDIAYQDLHFQTDFETGEKGHLQIFGFWGDDKNDFSGSTDSTMWEFQKDRFDINYSNNIFGLGARHTLLLGESSVLTSGVVFSANDASRIVQPTGQSDLGANLSLYTDEHQKLSSFINYQIKKSNKLRMSFGVQYQWFDDQTWFRDRSIIVEQLPSQRKNTGSLVRPNTSLTYQLSKSFQIEPSVGLSYWANNDESVLEPGIRLTYAATANTGITLSYQRRSQNTFQPLLRIFGEQVPDSKEVATKSSQFSLDIEHRPSINSSFKVAAFYTGLNDAYVFEDGVYYSQLFDAFSTQSVLQNGEERNYGIELTYQLQNELGTFYSANATIYKSEILQNNEWQSSRFDGGYIINLQGGKEFVKMKSTHKRTLGISARFTYFGGLRERPIDATSSRFAGTTVYQPSSGFTKQLSTYVRPDLSIYILKNKKNKTTRWYLDIQNVASLQNDGFTYFDAFQDQVLIKNQLTIIPILGWRAEF